jgi:two-component system probable response regulator PhcQ
MPSMVLFVDDDLALLEAMRRALRHERFQVMGVGTVEEARTVMATHALDVIVCDEGLHGTSGVEFLEEVRQSHPETMRLMLTGQISVGAAVQAINAAEVFRVLLKPCSKDALIETIHKALAHKAFLEQSRRSLAVFRQQNDLMQRLEQQHPGLIDQVANSDIGIVAAAVVSSGSPETLVGEFEVEIARASGMHKALPAIPPGKQISAP